MKFDLRINPGWTVIDAKTGLQVTRVRWVDDATHQVAWCNCARLMDKKAGVVATLSDVFGITPEFSVANCSDDEYVKGMPKVKIDNVRKTILVNVDDSIQPEEPVNESRPLQQQAGYQRVPAIMVVAFGQISF